MYMYLCYACQIRVQRDRIPLRRHGRAVSDQGSRNLYLLRSVLNLIRQWFVIITITLSSLVGSPVQVGAPHSSPPLALTCIWLGVLHMARVGCLRQGMVRHATVACRVRSPRHRHRQLRVPRGGQDAERLPVRPWVSRYHHAHYLSLRRCDSLFLWLLADQYFQVDVWNSAVLVYHLGVQRITLRRSDEIPQIADGVCSCFGQVYSPAQ
jgi:hypothetical protein